MTKNETETTEIASEIQAFSKVSKRLLETSPATRKGILLLLAHTTGMSQKKVKKVIEAGAQLARKYT